MSNKRSFLSSQVISDVEHRNTIRDISLPENEANAKNDNGNLKQNNGVSNSRRNILLYELISVGILIALWIKSLDKMQSRWGEIIEPMAAAYFWWFLGVSVVGWIAKKKDLYIFSATFLWGTRIVFAIPFFLIILSFSFIVIYKLFCGDGG